MANNALLKMAIFNSGKLQLVVAKKARIHETRLSKIVRGHVDATEDERRALARVLRKRVADLFPASAAASL
jgi:hypothetical protein